MLNKSCSPILYLRNGKGRKPIVQTLTPPPKKKKQAKAIFTFLIYAMNPKDICFICGGAEIRAADRSCLSDI
jgi:hypothetical protein